MSALENSKENLEMAQLSMGRKGCFAVLRVLGQASGSELCKWLEQHSRQARSSSEAH